jgi:hypothetical protein
MGEYYSATMTLGPVTGERGEKLYQALKDGSDTAVGELAKSGDDLLVELGQLARLVYEVDWHPRVDCVVTIEDDQARYGLDQWMAEPICLGELLQEAEVPYTGSDGEYEGSPGRIVSWAPGMAEKITQWTVQGEPYVSSPRWDGLREEGLSNDELVGKIEALFGRGIIPFPFPTDAGYSEIHRLRALEERGL